MTAERPGLTTGEAARRLQQAGPNELVRRSGPSPWAILFAQFRGAMTWVLVAALALSAVLGEAGDAAAIGTILVLNATVGFLQEYRAERALGALRSMTAPLARVLRDGRSVIVPAAEVVPGDVLVMEAGDLVAADARLLEAHALQVNEAALTGESLPVEKRTEPALGSAPLAERHDHVFMGTAVANGTGVAEVVATGMATEIGRIAYLLDTTTGARTPLQDRLERVGRTLLFLCLAVVAVVAALGVLRGRALVELLISSASLAVAAVPEGLAAIVTVALSIGVQRMASRHVLIRRLPSVETLGSATVICTDKTGTLTTGVMTVREIWGQDHAQVISAAAACVDAELSVDGRGGTGDPTEVALLVAAADRGISREAIERERPRMTVSPFDPVRKRMSILRADGTLYVKGAPEAVLPLCLEVPSGATQAVADMAERGLRVLCIAVGRGPEESDLRMLGVVGMADPPRTEAIDAVARARRAGIKTVMITGDHPITAHAIARELGVLTPGDDPVEVVHARATPEDKLRIVRGWKDRGAIVAMTGDGVNDAPALKEAHIGIAMGRTGTEVAREASAMVLTDDNFASIVNAVQEGRAIFENIRKALVYLLSGNAGELALVFAASVAGLPLPLTALQILWINLVTDGLPALALVMDPSDPNALERPPRPPAEPILGRSEWRFVLAIGLLEGTVSLLAFLFGLHQEGLAAARNLAFSTLVFGELFRSFAARSTTRTFWEMKPFTNVRLVAVVGITAVLQIGVHHIPFTQSLFDIGEVSLRDCVLSAALGLIPVTLIEISKLVRQRISARHDGSMTVSPVTP